MKILVADTFIDSTTVVLVNTDTGRAKQLCSLKGTFSERSEQLVRKVFSCKPNQIIILEDILGVQLKTQFEKDSALFHLNVDKTGVITWSERVGA